MSTLVVIQARTGSSRLPGKVRMPLAGKPLLERMVERVAAAREGATGVPFDITVATTTDASDDPIVELCRAMDVHCFRGHPTDLLDRHYQAALETRADTVVKIPSDCPLIDPAVIAKVIGFYRENEGKFDFVSNLHPATWPDGNDVEVMPIGALAQAFREATRPLEREHTTPFFWEHPERFRIGNVTWETGLDYSMSHRFTIDYPADYDFIAAVYDALYTPERPIFTLGDILALCERRPEIFALNQRYAGVNWYRNHLGELKTIESSQTRAVE